MMDLSKTLQEDIRINQINLKAAIQNHQALVVKLRGGNLADSSEVKLKLAGIQKHILSLGEAQKVLVARVKKELAANNSWTNHTSDRTERPNAELRVYPPSANCLDPTRKFNSTYQKRTIKEAKAARDGEDGDRKRNHDGVCDPPSKRVKTILHASSRPTSPFLSATHTYDQGTAPTSSEDSQESLTIDTSPEPSKVDFLSAVGLVNREQLMLSKSNNCVRRRRRHAGHHSQYSSQSHWDLTVQRRHRPRCEQDKEQQLQLQPTPPPPVPLREECSSSPVASPAIVEIKREQESSSGCSSPALSQDVAAKDHTLSQDKIVCTVCRKRGILSVCDICSTAFHWFCLEKGKQCPVCLVSQVGESIPTPFHHHNHHHTGSTDATVNKVMGQTMSQGGQTSKPPHHVTSDEVFTRYYKRVPPSNDNNSNYTERLKVKKSLEARNETLKLELDGLKKKATELSAALVSQTENIKKLTAGEEKTNEKIKKILDIINFFKAAPS